MDKKYNLFHSNSKIQKKIIEKNNFTYRNIISELEHVVSRIGKEEIKILDFGCGVGTIDFYLASKLPKSSILGIDISPLSIDIAKKSAEAMGLKNNLSFSNTLNFRKNKFDIIVCSEVIEHIKDDVGLIKKLGSCLDKNGVLLLTTPSQNAPLFRMGLANEFDKRVGHLRRYTPENLKQIVEKLGFKTLKILKTEGIARNSLFLIPHLGFLIKFIKGPVSDLLTIIDNLLVKLFGESDIFIIAQKI